MPREEMPSLSEREAVGLKLRAARKAADLSTAQAAERGGLSVTQLGAIERGDHSLTSVSAAGLSRLPAAFGLRPQAFLEIVAPTYAPYISLLSDRTLIDDMGGKSMRDVGGMVMNGTVSFPPYTMKSIHALASASLPLDELEPLPDLSPIPVENSRLRPGTVLFLVEGDSMTIGGVRGIMDGDTIFVDTHDLTPQDGRVFVLHIQGNGVTVKRLRRLGSEYWCFSDSEDQQQYPPFQADSARIIGRVYDGNRRLDAQF